MFLKKKCSENVKKAEFGDEFSSDEEESVQEKRLRLAKEYLSKLEEEGFVDMLTCFLTMYIIKCKQ